MYNSFNWFYIQNCELFNAEYFNAVFQNVHLILEIRSKATDVIKKYWTLCGFNFEAILASVRPPGASVWVVTQRYLSAVTRAELSLSLSCNCRVETKNKQNYATQKRPLEAVKG